MKKTSLVVMVSILSVLFLSCCNNNSNSTNNMETNNKETKIFPKGNLNEYPFFTGTSYLQRLSSDPETFDCTVSNVTFEPGCRNFWHSHPGGQILLVISGEGWYQERDGEKRLIKPGDVVEIKPNVWHWHGATPDSEMAHLAIGTKNSAGEAEWGEPVTDEEYLK